MGKKEEREESRKRKGEMEKEGIERRRKSRMGHMLKEHCILV